jgi:acetoin:2,6-dichlorophenolindophenol oxidoreductase subunit beta
MTATQTSAAPADTELRPMMMGMALNEALDIALGLDPSVFLLGEDIAEPSGGVYKITKGLSTKYGADRVRKTPISEAAILGAAVGAAIAGKRPVAEIMIMDFLAVCMDQLSNHAGKIRYMSGGQTTVPMVVRTSAGAGRQFGAQHSELLEAWAIHTPGIKVAVPSSPADAKGLLLSAIFDDDPVLFIEPMLMYWDKSYAGHVPEGDARVPLGKANVLRSGDAVTVISYGRQVHECMAVASSLADAGAGEVEVIDIRTPVPLDLDTILGSVSRTKGAVIVHEAVTVGGFGAEVSSQIHEHLFSELRGPVQRVGGANTPIPYAKNLETAFLPQRADIEAAIRKLL